MTKTWPRSLVLAGAGKMGGALLRGWVSGGLDPGATHVLDPHLDAETVAFCRARGVSRDPPAAAPEVLVLAVKPQTFAADPGAFSAWAGPGTTIVSVLAGQTLANLRAGLPDAGAIVRAMPNLPASVGRGAAGLAGEPGRLSPSRKAMVGTLLEAVGIAEWLDESRIDAVTAVSGSGPAYVFYLVECLAKAGYDAGLPADVAMRLARATLEGSAALMIAAPERSPTQWREAVTSPGGTTAAALDVLRQRGGLEALMGQAVDAAMRRASELAG